MAKHDILLYNSASKGFTTNINSDTVRIKGSSDELLSIENSSGTKNLQIDTIGSNFTFNAPLTASGNFSGSLATTASFGRVVANRFAGDASQMTNTPISDGTVSSSAQLAVNISGSFDEGFTHSGAVSGSSTSTGSFGFATSTKYDSNINISGITNKIPANTISSSAQIASEISGAFDSGFEFTGTISGSSTSTGSFSRFIIGDKIINGDGQFLTNISYTPSTFSSSFQIASEISGAFDEGFTYSGGLDANQRFTASFVGVSGSAFAYANHSATTMSISSTSGSDFDYRLNDALTGGQIKGTSYGMGSWSAGPNKIVAQGSPATAGTQNAYLSMGGYTSPYQQTEKYNGTSWAASANLITANYTMVGAGTQNAVVIFGGSLDHNGSELYNGGAWSNGPDRINATRYAGSAGTQNASIVFGGLAEGGNTPNAKTENFNGTTFTALNDMASDMGIGASGGTQNAAIQAGTYTAPAVPNSLGNVQLWNGSNWSETTNLIQTRRSAGGIGTQNHFLAVGGESPSYVTSTEEWNGTSWSEINNLITARAHTGGNAHGLGTAGIVAGGFAGSPAAGVNSVELWNAGSSTTGSFGAIFSNNWSITDSSGITGATGALTAGTVSGSTQLATQISGSFQKGFQFTGAISGSSTTTGSFGRVFASDYSILNTALIKPTFLNTGTVNGLISGLTGVIPNNTLTSSAQIASAISGSFDEGFNYVGNLSGSKTTTGSFNLIHALEYPNIDASAFLNHPTASGTVTGSSQLAADISASFNKGFEFTGLISGSSNSTGSLNNFISDKLVTKNFLNNNGINVIPHVGNSFFDTRQYMPTGSQLFSCGSCTEFSNGYNNADGQLSIGTDGILNISFQTSSLNQAVIPGAWSSGPDTITIAMASAVGTQNSSLFISGKDLNGGNTPTLHTQHYNGVSWRLGGNTLEDKGAQVQGQAFGIQNSAQAGPSRGAGNKTKEMQYNGVSWYIVQSMQTNRCFTGAAGTTDAGLRFGKGDSPYSGITEEWNGHSWSEVTAMGDAREGALGGGTQNAGITGGGFQSPTATELYDGNTWSEAAAHTVSAADRDGASGGTQNNFSINLNLDKSETFDGVTWSVNPTLTIDRYQPGFAGQGSLGMVMGGSNASGNAATTDTLEWNGSFASGSFLQTRKIASNYS